MMIAVKYSFIDLKKANGRKIWTFFWARGKKGTCDFNSDFSLCAGGYPIAYWRQPPCCSKTRLF